MIFNASLDRSVKITTWIGTIILFIPLTISLLQETKFGHLPIWLGVLFALLYLFIYMIHPQSFEISSSQITIHRILKNKTIEFSSIANISILTPEMMSDSYRLFGFRGLWGNFGLYSNQNLGEFQAYTTGFVNAVLIELTNGEKLVISPKEAEKFVQMSVINR
jgi:hypothetical protein